MGLLDFLFGQPEHCSLICQVTVGSNYLVDGLLPC